MTWFLGIDPSPKEYHGCTLLDEHKEEINQVKVGSTEELITYVGRCKEEALRAGHQLLIGMEEIYHSVNREMVAAGYSFYSIMPLKVAAFKKTFLTNNAKTDLLDSAVVAMYVYDWHTRLTPYQMRDPVEENGWKITKNLELLRASKTASWERFWGIVTYSCPKLKDLEICFETQWFLLAVEELLLGCKTLGATGFIKGCEKRGSQSDHTKLSTLLVYFKRILRDGNASMLVCQATQIRLQLKELRMWERRAREVLAQWEYGWILERVRGLGPRTMIALLAYLGRNWDDLTVSQVSAYSGVAPIHMGSSTPPKKIAKFLSDQGKRFKQNRRVHRVACNQSLKTALCLFSLYSLTHNDWAKKKYRIYRDRGQSHWEALRNLSIKWLRIIFYLVRNKAIYDPHRVAMDMNLA